MSLVSVVAMGLLFLLEFSTYLTPTYKTDIVVDEQVDAKMKVFFDFTIFDLPCRHAIVDVEDSVGMSKHNVSKHIIKVRLDAKGRNLGEHKDLVCCFCSRFTPLPLPAAFCKSIACTVPPPIT